MKRTITVAICHYNTPELTEAAIWSLRKHGGEDWPVVIFDNSDQRPFTAKMKGVKVINNRKGQIIDFERELEKFPNRDVAQGFKFGTANHLMSVQWLMDNTFADSDFLLMDSDILIKRDPSVLIMPEECTCGYIQSWQKANNPGQVDRLVPFLLYINTPMCRAGGARFYDPERCWALNGNRNDRRNWYDTGASFLEDIKTKKPLCHGKVLSRDIYVSLFEHYQKGSWQRTDINHHKAWLEQHRELWEPTPRMRGITEVAVCAIGRCENRYAVEWVEHYLKIGVKKLYLYDNGFGDEERLADVLTQYIADGSVEVIDWRDRKNQQCASYEDCYTRHGGEYAWMGFFDFDELLNIGTRRSLPATLQMYTAADCVIVNWRIFTDKATKHGQGMRDRFKMIMEPGRCVKYFFPENNHVKAIVRGGIKGLQWRKTPHVPSAPSLNCVNGRGEAVGQTPFCDYDYGMMWLDHYTTKTAEEFVAKVKRGFPCGDRYTAQYRRNAVEYFFKINERTPEKEAVLAELAQ